MGGQQQQQVAPQQQLCFGLHRQNEQKAEKRACTRNNMIALMVGWKVKLEMLKRSTVQPHDAA